MKGLYACYMFLASFNMWHGSIIINTFSPVDGWAKYVLRGSIEFSLSWHQSVAHMRMLDTCPSIVTQGTLIPLSCSGLKACCSKTFWVSGQCLNKEVGNGRLPVALQSNNQKQKGHTGLIKAISKIHKACHCLCVTHMEPASWWPCHVLWDTLDWILVDLYFFVVVANLKIMCLNQAWHPQSATSCFR